MASAALQFSTLIDTIAQTFFGGSIVLTGLVMLVIAWAVCLVIIVNTAKNVSPVMSVVPMIPISIFFTAYGILSVEISVIIVIAVSALVASSFRSIVSG